LTWHFKSRSSQPKKKGAAARTSLFTNLNLKEVSYPQFKVTSDLFKTLQNKDVKAQFGLDGVKLCYMTGTIANNEIKNFSKLIYRTSRGKVLSYFDQEHFKLTELDGTTKERIVYMLVFQAGEVLSDRMERLCDIFQCKKYPLPQEGYAAPDEFAKIMSQLKSKVLTV